MSIETSLILESIFKNAQNIPIKYTADGEDVSPPLKVKGIPLQTKSLVLIVDDPDAPHGTFDHWVVWNIPSNIQIISEGASELNQEPVKQGINGYGVSIYKGPNPPPGNPHRYYFKLYALDIPSLDLPQGATKQQVEKSIQGHILDQTELMGIYQRNS